MKNLIISVFHSFKLHPVTSVSIKKALVFNLPACLCCQDVVSEAQGKIFKWKKQVVSLTNIPTDDPVVQEILRVLGSLSYQVEVMAKLLSTTLGEKHWKAVFKGQRLYSYCIICILCGPLHMQYDKDEFNYTEIGPEYDPDKKVTVGEIIPQQLESQKLIKNVSKFVAGRLY